MMNTAFLSLGSNIEPEDNLAAAVSMLVRLTTPLGISSVWETRALGMGDQPNYLNAAAIVGTRLSAEQLKRGVINNIELNLGRVRQRDKYAARAIDIDIMLFNHEILDLAGRHIPDPEILERPFVAIPLAELAPNYEHPETCQTLHDIAQSFESQQEEMLLRQDVSHTLEKLLSRHQAME